jgi:hypothetical protein
MSLKISTLLDNIILKKLLFCLLEIDVNIVRERYCTRYNNHYFNYFNSYLRSKLSS